MSSWCNRACASRSVGVVSSINCALRCQRSSLQRKVALTILLQLHICTVLFARIELFGTFAGAALHSVFGCVQLVQAVVYGGAETAGVIAGVWYHSCTRTSSTELIIQHHSIAGRAPQQLIIPDS
jgi:(2Fe-2S) ferredoxin